MIVFLKRISAIILFCFCSFAVSAFSQQLPPRELQTSATEQISVPADIVIFTVAISVSDPSAAVSFSKHRILENKLSEMLSANSIPDSAIRYTLVNIARADQYSPDGKPKREFRTDQNASIRFRNFSQYDKFQIALIDAGFDSFSATFGSTHEDEAKTAVLTKAIEKAMKKAEMMAKSAKTTLGRLRQLTHYDHEAPYPTPMLMRGEMKMMDSSPSLTTIPQTVQFSTTVTISYELGN